MFIAVIAGRVIAALFAFCGIVNIISYAGTVTRSMGYFKFIEDLAGAAWPLAAAATVWILVELLLQLEKLVMLNEAASVPMAMPRKSKSTPAPAPANGGVRKSEAAPSYFNAPAQPEPQETPAPAPAQEIPAPAPAPKPADQEGGSFFKC